MYNYSPAYQSDRQTVQQKASLKYQMPASVNSVSDTSTCSELLLLLLLLIVIMMLADDGNQ